MELTADNNYYQYPYPISGIAKVWGFYVEKEALQMRERAWCSMIINELVKRFALVKDIVDYSNTG